MKNPLSTIYPRTLNFRPVSYRLLGSQTHFLCFNKTNNTYNTDLALPLDLFGSTDKANQDHLLPVESLSLSTDTFERCLAALASETKWPINYIRSERQRRECDRLALYLLGVVDTFMSDGPKRSTICHFKHIF